MSDIIKKSLQIENQRGLHARAAAKFVKCAEEFDAEVMVTKDDNHVSGTSIMGLMMLAASKGTSIDIQVSGAQAADAATAIETLVNNRFDEE